MKRGRKGRADLAVSLPGPGEHRLRPPPDLDPEAAATFKQLVASLPASHFAPSDAPLLGVYCTVLTVSCRSAAGIGKDPAALATWEKATRLVAQLAPKLRLCPSSRADAKTVARRVGDYRPSYYERM